jgi:carbamoyl-phosphate synthase large subunit
MGMNIAVTAAGGGIGQSIIKCFQRTKYKTVGIDPRSNAAGLYMADIGCLGKNLEDRGYIESILKICKTHKCSFIFPGLDAELKILARNAERFKAIGVTPIISSKKTVELSDDKWILNQFLKNNGFPYIKTARTLEEARAIGITCPMILKPMLDGCRSKDVEICEDEVSVLSLLRMSPNKYILQEYIDGDEYTCGSVTFNKNVIGTISMRRVLRDGDTYKAYVESNKHINKFLMDLLPKLNPFGPCNIQMRLRKNTPYVLEINARCSGTTAARALAGFNEPVLVCDYLSGNRIDYKIKEIAILRYWNEQVVEYDTIKEIEDEGFIHRNKWCPW